LNWWLKFIKINNKWYWLSINKNTNGYGGRVGKLWRFLKIVNETTFYGGFTLRKIADSLVCDYLDCQKEGSVKHSRVGYKEFKQWDGTYNSD
jgi:2-hydroxy-3-keto-5-methylthiopentenyl-1-phosphate phosphatase